MDTVHRFDGKVADYSRYRERYDPQILLPVLREYCGLTPEWHVADIGAGTGMLADVFLANGNSVIAVEPNPEMRQACSELHPGDGHLHIVEGTAETTGLASGSVQMVSAGRAMHWFDPERSMAEFRRILVPDGWVAIIAFGRSETGCEENEALEHLLRSFSPDHADTHATYTVYRNLSRYLTRDLHHWQQTSTLWLDWESLHGLVLSFSSSPSREHPRYAEFEAALRHLFEKYGSEKGFPLQNRYWVNLGRFA